MEALDNGRKVVDATRTLAGYLGGVHDAGGVPTVLLQPSESASAIVEGSDTPASPSRGSCPPVTSILVTPPNTRTSVRLTATPPGCSTLQVHPVVPGTTGNLS